MKNKIIAVFLIVSMIMVLIPTTSFAIEEKNYFVGSDKEFKTVIEAVKQWNSDGKPTATIRISNGTYITTDDINAKHNPLQIKGVDNHLTLIGEDRDKTVLKATTGRYIHPALDIQGGNVTVKNLTCISNHESDPNFNYLEKSSGSVNSAYGIHIDSGIYSGTITIENCKVESYQSCVVGLGTLRDSNIVLKNCELNCFMDYEQSPKGYTEKIKNNPDSITIEERIQRAKYVHGERGAIVYHNFAADRAGNESLSVIGCKIYSSETPYILKILDANIKEDEIIGEKKFIFKDNYCYGDAVTNINNYIIIPSHITIDTSSTGNTCPLGSLDPIIESKYEKNPEAYISLTSDMAPSQTATLILKDNLCLAGYYWGGNSDYLKNSFTPISGTEQVVEKRISNPARYYLTAIDNKGYVSKTISFRLFKTTLDANGGEVSPGSILCEKGTITLPIPTREGYDFTGWYLEQSGGERYDSNLEFTVDNNRKIYAQWEKQHIHDFVHIVEPSTCITKGVEYDLCNLCGEKKNVEEISLSNHISGEWSIVVAATTENEGLKIKRCSLCGKITDIEVIERISKISIVPKEDSKVVVDDELKLIICSFQGINNLDNDLILHNCELQFEKTGKNFGTGTKVNLICDGNICDTYYLVIIGDIDGDGYVDAFDVSIVSEYINQLYETTNKAYFKAMDIVDDGYLDATDLACLINICNLEVC